MSNTYAKDQSNNPTFGSRPAADLASQVDTNNLGALELPRNTSHDIDGVSTADTTSNHSEAARIGGVRVGTNHKPTRESIVLQYDLVNDTRTGFPKAETILRNCHLR
jgi:hypothetical protein